MNEQIAKSVAFIIKLTFLLIVGYVIWHYAPPEFWAWFKTQAEWAANKLGKLFF